ncbi:GNAT family N-acetyltransferase [Ideonella sp. YS5]|uniref:GNAT family N-acetyltransferase n=1 Tax=Ideonella sp. YS5 TaxID=3453714 RepID=UPI003EE92E20
MLNLCGSSYTPAQLDTWFEERTHEIHYPSIKAGQLFLAEKGSRVLGFFGFCPGEVTLLFVRPEAAGSGLGSQLFALAVLHAQVGHEGPVVVVATVNSRPFYEKHGFVVVEESYFVRGATETRFKVFRMQRAFHAQPSNPSVKGTSRKRAAPYVER